MSFADPCKEREDYGRSGGDTVEGERGEEWEQYLAEGDLVGHAPLDVVDIVVHHREGHAHRENGDDLRERVTVGESTVESSEGRKDD